MTTVKNSKKLKYDDILTLVEECTSGMDLTPWEGTVRDYLPLVVEHPEYNETAHSRICRMVEDMGVDFEGENKNPRYKFFEQDLFGIDHVLAQVMEFFRAAAKGSDARKRLLLLWGPTSSGKSEFLIQIKKGLEAFSQTAEGKVFAIDGCPMHENPLNVIPIAARKSLKEKYGIIVEGELCPKCAYRLKEEFDGDFWKLPVKRVFLSEMHRIGIGTFQPGDTKCVTGDSLVLLDNSLTEISNLGIENEENIKNNVVCSDGSIKETDIFFRYEDREVVNISTNLGYSISATQNHPLKTVNLDGEIIWKNIEDLSIGDTLVMSCGVFPDSFDQKESPLGWTDDFAKFLGLYVAEGCFYKPGYTTMEITNFNKEVHKIVKDAKPSTPDRMKMRQGDKGILINDKTLIRTMQEWGFTTGAHNKSIPEIVFKSGKVKQFLHGLWLGDGNIGKNANKNTNEAIYSTVSNTLARQVHLLLLMLGIPSRLSFEENIGTSGAYKILVTGERVEKLKDILGLPDWKITRPLTNVVPNTNIFLMPRIDNLIKNITSCTKYLSSWHRYSVSTKSYGRRFSRNSLENFITEAAEKGCPDKYVSAVKKLCNENYLYVSIKKMTRSVADVYDISVPDGHEFLANNFISHNSQSQSELVGSVNFAKLEDYGVESHPLAYNFDGELNVANRGVMEFIELLKVDPKFRHILLTLVQEKRIKVERFPLIYADLVPIGHSNETEFVKFKGDKKEEALHDRLWLVPFPYNLKVSSEIKIYEKLICNAVGFKDIHIAPHTLKIAAMFAILSRLQEPKDKSISVLQKMHLYDGEEVDGFTKEDIKELQRVADREGLDGISPRFVVNRLSACLAQHGTTYITPISALRSLKDGLPSNAKLDEDDVERLENIVSLCVEEYNKIAMNEVQKAFFVNFEHEIKNLLENYLDNVAAYLDDSKRKNEWDEMVDPDEGLMRSIEEKVEITSTGKDSFRSEVYRKMLKSKTEDGEYGWQSHPKLKEALQKQLFEERADTIRLTVSTRNPEPEALKKLNAVIGALVEHHGYTAESANELLRYVNNIMSRTK